MKNTTTKRSPKMEKILQHKMILKKIAQIFKGHCMYTAAKHFLQDVGIEASIGTIAKFFHQYCPYYYAMHFGYGHGKQAVKGRIYTEKFTCRRNKEVYVKHNGQWVKEYIVKMEDELKNTRKLLKQLNSTTDLVVHHKDGNHLNNRKSNLKVMTRIEHSRLHMVKLLKGSRV